MTLTTESAARKDRTTGKTATLEHRHFAAIATIIAHIGKDDPELLKVKPLIISHFAVHLADTNPRFDRGRFAIACTRSV